MICRKWDHPIVSAVWTQFEIGKYLRESDHAEEIAFPEAPPELRLQLCAKCVHYLLPILHPLLS